MAEVGFAEGYVAESAAGVAVGIGEGVPVAALAGGTDVEGT